MYNYFVGLRGQSVVTFRSIVSNLSNTIRKKCYFNGFKFRNRHFSSYQGEKEKRKLVWTTNKEKFINVYGVNTVQ
jgi:hypothetical protein